MDILALNLNDFLRANPYYTNCKAVTAICMAYCPYAIYNVMQRSPKYWNAEVTAFDLDIHPSSLHLLYTYTWRLDSRSRLEARSVWIYKKCMHATSGTAGTPVPVLLPHEPVPVPVPIWENLIGTGSGPGTCFHVSHRYRYDTGTWLGEFQRYRYDTGNTIWQNSAVPVRYR